MTTMRRLLLWLNTRRLAAIILFVALFTMAVQVPTDTDTWWHLQAGKVTLEQGRILQTDLFSHTKYGSGWVNHSWLSQVILYALFSYFSYAGLGLWVGVVVTAALALVYLQMEGGVFSRAFILVLAAAASAVIWSARPQLLSFFLTAVVTYILHLFKRRGVNRLWLLPPIFVLWVNLHAGYALGFMVLLAFVAGELLNHVLERCMPSGDPVVGWRGIGLVAAVGLLSALLLVINPSGTRMWTYYVETVSIDALQDFIQEWRSPDFHPLHTQPFIWLLLATTGAIGLSGRRVDGTDLTLMSGFAYAGLLAARNFGPFALVTAPVLSRHVTAILSQWDDLRLSGPRSRTATPTQAAINWVLLAFIIALALLKIHVPLQPAVNEARQREVLPLSAVEWIKEQQPEGKLFNHYNWGGYLIWHLWPDYRVFVDGRTDLYGNAFLHRYLNAQMARPGFRETLREYGINLVVTPTESPLSMQLACLGGWSEAYRDELATIWVRETTE